MLRVYMMHARVRVYTCTRTLVQRITFKYSLTFQLITHTVGMYSPGKLLLTCAIIIHVFPTVPSPTATHFTCFRLVDIFVTQQQLASPFSPSGAVPSTLAALALKGL